MAESAAPPAAAPPARVCAVCAAEAVEQCVRCKVAAYCSRRCQKRHWSRGRHKYRCFSPEARAKRAAFDTPENCRQLWLATLNGDEAAARDLIVRGANVDYQEAQSGSTPLVVAAEKGHAAIVRALLDAGADTDLAANDGGNPLYIAAYYGHEAIVRTLLDAGAGKDLADNDGATPLFVAAENGHGAIVRALLDAGADKTARCLGKTALDVAKTAEIKGLLA